MRKVESLLSQYGESHQNKTNKLIHWICVPLIYLSVIGLLWCVKLGDTLVLSTQLNLAMVITPLVMFYYFRLNFKLAAGMLAMTLISFSVSEAIELVAVGRLWMVMLGIFVFSWILQFIGHGIEGKKPSFAEDLQFFLIGPAWILGALYRALGIRY